MKQLNRLFAALAVLSLCLLGGCSREPDAGVLLREAGAEAEKMTSCSADFEQTLVFTADGAQHTRSSSNRIVYSAKPFGLKSVQSVQEDGVSGGSETYTVTESGRLNFYYKTDGVWRKTDAGNLDTSPFAQVDILRLLSDAQDQKYVRETTLDSQKVHKIELKLSSEALRSPIETIATATGMADDSKTVVQTLLDSAPALYGYCYIGTDSGRIVRIEADLSEAADRIFQNIDGSRVSVHVSKCEISGDISDAGSAPAVVLPKAAESASSVQAYG